MKVNIRKTSGFYDGREVPYLEMEVVGDKHTLTVRKYPKTVSVQMWKNSDKHGTKVSYKLPHDKFQFVIAIPKVVSNFETQIAGGDLADLAGMWHDAEDVYSF